MSKKSDQVKSGYAGLDANEKAELKRFIESFDRQTINEQRNMSDTLSKSLGKAFGPINTDVCGCCGK